MIISIVMLLQNQNLKKINFKIQSVTPNLFVYVEFLFTLVLCKHVLLACEFQIYSQKDALFFVKLPHVSQQFKNFQNLILFLLCYLLNIK